MMKTTDIFNKKILVVDDNDLMREQLIKDLKELKFTNIVAADNVTLAKETVINSFNAGELVELILCDHHMPNNTGLDLLNFIRMSIKFNSLAYITVTSDSDRSVVLPYIAAGADSFIVKPANTKDLISKIKQVVEKRSSLY